MGEVNQNVAVATIHSCTVHEQRADRRRGREIGIEKLQTAVLPRTKATIHRAAAQVKKIGTVHYDITRVAFFYSTFFISLPQQHRGAWLPPCPDAAPLIT